MNALANDQLERLRRLLRGSRLDISFALYTGDSESSARNLREEPAESERVSRAAIQRNPPDILLTNYKQLEFLLVRVEDRVLFTPALRYLVLDELHSYRGALASEIACLIRRLKAHARVAPGELLGVGTSATVAAVAGGERALADFATVLFGETFRAQDMIGESLLPFHVHRSPWIPPAPSVADEALMALDPSEEPAVVALAERLTGRRCPADGPVAQRIAAVFVGNAVVQTLEDVFSQPAALSEAVQALRDRIPDRTDQPDDALQREVEAYLLVGSIGDEEHPPRLRPKLHVFLHGIYDVALCLEPSCRTLVPHGGTECLKCGSAARPAALCRTCGQDFVKVRFEREADDLPVGTGDFYSDERTGFLTYRVHQLPEAQGVTDEDAADADTGEPPPRRADAEEKLQRVWLCVACGRVLHGESACPSCNRTAVPYLLHRWLKKEAPRAGVLHVCPACGDSYTKGDIVTPLRTGTASSVAVLVERHLDLLEGEDRKLLLFADNRQDVAHQAGYTADKHRGFALRHLVAYEVRAAGRDGIYLQELPERLFNAYQRLGIIQRRPRWSAPPHRLCFDLLRGWRA